MLQLHFNTNKSFTFWLACHRYETLWPASQFELCTSVLNKKTEQYRAVQNSIIQAHSSSIPLQETADILKQFRTSHTKIRFKSLYITHGISHNKTATTRTHTEETSANYKIHEF